MAADAFEVVGYFFGAWLYVFSPKFRQAIHQEWRNAIWWEKLLLLVQFGVWFVCGVVLPALVIWWFIDGQIP
jgi:hypothetical protein